jgi:hypothetical protein
VTMPVAVSGAVEGLVDEAVVGRLIHHVGAVLGPMHGKNGKTPLRARINGYNNAARFSPWIVLVDLDQEADCAPPLVGAWVPTPAPRLCFRVAVREVEAWLLADRERIARFLRVRIQEVPDAPETLPDPKQFVVELARRSRRREIRQEMVPRPGSGRAVGPAYTASLIEFVTDVRHGWRPAVAAHRADSLARCIRRLRRMVEAA